MGKHTHHEPKKEKLRQQRKADIVLMHTNEKEIHRLGAMNGLKKKIDS